MQGRTPPDAVNDYIGSIQRAISCISDSVVNVDGGYYPADTPHILTMNRGSSVELGGVSRLWFLLRQYYRIVELDALGSLWTVRVVGYRYAILDSDGREVLEYHWHPGGNSPIENPHLHIEYGAMVGRPEISAAHLPTGHVFVGDILHMLIRDFAVTPRRRDWQSVLDEGSGSNTQ